MRYRIGIDLGTNSLGWAGVELRPGEDGALTAGPMLDMGVRIFSDARNPKDKSSNAAQRREPRGARRNRDRKLGRRRKMMRALIQAGLMPTDEIARKALEQNDPWILRAEALDRRLEPYEIGRALFHLQQRRGFKSNRKTDGDEDGAMYAAIEAARVKMQAEGARTLGELLGRLRKEQLSENKQMPEGQRKPLPQARVKARSEGAKMAYDYYPDRAMIVDEFDQVWAAQAAHHPTLMTSIAQESLRSVIKDQRPLKAQKAGKCTFLPDQPRAPKALPSAQYARVLQEVNNLMVGATGDRARELSEEQWAKLIAFLMAPTNKTGRRTFKSIRKCLSLSESQKFNLESAKRDHLLGDETAARMMQDEAWGKTWLDIDRATQDEIVLRLLETEEVTDLVAWLGTHHGLDEDRARAVCDVRLPDQHGNLSAAALARLIPHMEAGMRYDEAATEEFNDHRGLGDGVIYEDGLPYYGEILSRHTAFEKDPPESGEDTRNAEERYGRVANPTVHVALNELRKVINDLIKRWGPPTEVVLELARDLPLSDRGLRELESMQKKNQDANDERRKYLDSIKEADTYENRLKLRLYEEALDAFSGTAQCVFTGKSISKSALFAGDVEVEHILPLSRTLDDSFSNKVLSLRLANRIKGNKTPAEAFAANPEGFDWEAIGQRAAALPSSKTWRFAPNAFEQWEARGGDFLARQLNDTRYIARLGKSFVEALFGGQGVKGQRRSVWVVPGRLTSDLRHYAGFNTLTGFTDTNQKDRTDHRHHAVDALIVALTDQAMVKRCADLARREDSVAHYEIMLAMAEPLKRYRKSAEDRLSKLVVSHKPDHGFQDAMHNDTAYGITGLRDDKKQMILVTRKPLDALEPKHIADIVDPLIREHLAYATEGLKGAAFNDAIVAAGEAMSPPVRRVRLTTPMKDSSYVVIRHGEKSEHAKAYKGDGNYCYDIFMGKKGKWTGEVITIFEAYQNAQKDPDWWRSQTRPDGSPLIMRIRKGDMLEIASDDGVGPIMCQVSQITPGKVILAKHFEANVDQRTRGSYKGDAPLKYIFKAPSSLQKANAKRLTVSPSGKVRRHKV
ncbi:CRISPR-associated endonuclease Cas9 [Durusdinium trenchii]|uniref:CRISPR-associated endonuclease Cas9 n=1 Tax=Durusdinium trenchii TaxID=1381693 RepID=A0ABP0LJY6_9DINO